MNNIIIAYDGTEVIDTEKFSLLYWNPIEEIERLEYESYLYSKIRKERKQRKVKKKENLFSKLQKRRSRDYNNKI